MKTSRSSPTTTIDDNNKQQRRSCVQRKTLSRCIYQQQPQTIRWLVVVVARWLIDVRQHEHSASALFFWHAEEERRHKIPLAVVQEVDTMSHHSFFRFQHRKKLCSTFMDGVMEKRAHGRPMGRLWAGRPWVVYGPPISRPWDAHKSPMGRPWAGPKKCTSLQKVSYKKKS